MRVAVVDVPRRVSVPRKRPYVDPTARTIFCPSFGSAPRRRAERAVKRLIDIAGALVGLILTAPLFALVAIAVKLDSRGPVFFGQVRVGRNLTTFRIWKFRSMRVGAEFVHDELAARHRAARPLFKLEDDPRMTRVGRFIRRWSLDELPQLWNVLRGDMSLVGPRPPLPSEVTADGLRQPLRLRARPGVTGPWQVNGRCLLPYRDGVALDLAYLRDWSLVLDLQILARTPWAVLTKRGAY